MSMVYKLFKKYSDGTYGPTQVRLENLTHKRYRIGEVYIAEDAMPSELAHRPGFHCCALPYAPHMDTQRSDRVWCLVAVQNCRTMQRPLSQGGEWYVAQKMTVLSEVSDQEVNHILMENDMIEPA